MQIIEFKIWYRGMKDNSFTVAMPLSKTFDHFMDVILDQMEWDHDHQYAIYCSYAGSTVRTKCKNAIVFTTYPIDDDEGFSSCKLNCLDWDKIKDVFVNFDFGDDHWFDCKIVKKFDAPTTKIKVISPLKIKWDQYPEDGSKFSNRFATKISIPTRSVNT